MKELEKEREEDRRGKEGAGEEEKRVMGEVRVEEDKEERKQEESKGREGEEGRMK